MSNQMFDNKNVKPCLDNLKSWLSARQSPQSEDVCHISAPEELRSKGFGDLIVDKFCVYHQDDIIYSSSSSPSSTSQDIKKPMPWTELTHLVNWTSEFAQILEDNKGLLAALELLKANNEYPISKATFHVEEAKSVVESAINFELGLDLQHPFTRNTDYAVTKYLIDDHVSIMDIVRKTFGCLFSKCVVKLVMKSSHFYSATMAALLVDLMYKSGATSYEVQCLCLDRRESLGSEMRFLKPITPNRNSKLSVLALVFKQTDTFAACQGIIESYFREMYPKLIVLVEESAYDRFVVDWQRYYSHALQIGSASDLRTSVVESFNSKVLIDLAAIDIVSAHKASGHNINVLKFKNGADLMSLLSHLRKVPYVSVWHDDILSSKDLCMKLNLSHEFWINHVPKSLAGRRFCDDMLKLCDDAMAADKANVYNQLQSSFAEEADTIRKMLAAFAKKDPRLRSKLIIESYVSAVTKSKALRNGLSVSEAVARLKRFQAAYSTRLSTQEPGDSTVECHYKPVGLAMILAREEVASAPKSKPMIMDLIFKNLLIGNGVLLCCPANTLGAKFAIEYDHILPFKMVQDDMPDMSRLSLDVSTETVETSATATSNKRSCPKNTYAFEILPEMTQDTCDAIMIALGTRPKNIWLPDGNKLNYWVE